MHPWSTFASEIPCLMSGPSARGKDSCHEGRAGLLRGCAGCTQAAAAASPSQPHSHPALSPRSVSSPWPPVGTSRCRQCTGRHAASQIPDVTCWTGSVRVSTEENWVSGKKKTPSCPLNTWYFRTGTIKPHPQAPRRFKEPSSGCSSTLSLPPNTSQNVLSAQGLAQWQIIPVWG